MGRLITSALETAKNPENIDFFFYIDEDDILSQIKTEELTTQLNNRVVSHIGPRIIMTEMTNVLAKICKSEVMFLAGDDIVFRTSDWDTMVIDSLNQWPDHIAWVFGYDGYHKPGDFGTHGAIHKNWVDVLGYVVPPIYSADWADTTLCEISKNLGRFCYIPAYIEHMHYVVGKGEIDETMREKIIRGNQDRTGQRFIDSLPHRVSDAQKLLDFINRTNGSTVQLNYQRFYP